MSWILLGLLCGPIGPDARADVEAGGLVATLGADSADSLVKTLINHHDALFALALNYKEVSADRPSQPAGAYLRRSVAASRPGSFIRDNAHGHNKLDLTQDPSRKTLLITPTESVLLENLNQLVVDFEYERKGSAPPTIQNELIFDVLSWWPFTDWPLAETHGHPFAMNALKDGAYRLLPRRDLIKSRPCYILEMKDANTVIWIDCERPQCVLQKDVYNPRTQSVASRYELMDYREVGDGIWLPGCFRNMQFDSNAHTPQLRERLIIDATFSISDVRINHQISPETFRLDLGPGAVHKVISAGRERYEPMRDGQVDYFVSIVDWSRAVSRSRVESYSVLWDHLCLILFAIGVVVGAAAFLLASRPSDR